MSRESAMQALAEGAPLRSADASLSPLPLRTRATAACDEPRVSERKGTADRTAANEVDDAQLLGTLRARTRGATELLFAKYGEYVRRLVGRVLGFDQDLYDVVHDVFVQILRDVHRVEQADALRGWIRSVTVFTVRRHLRTRARRRWLRFVLPEEVPEVEAPAAPEGASEALRAVSEALAVLSSDERIAFSLRHLEELELTEVASACGVSLSTVKRRLKRAEERFDALALRDPRLAGWRRVEEP